LAAKIIFDELGTAALLLRFVAEIIGDGAMKILIGIIIGIVAAPLLLIVVGLVGHLGSTATATPPAWEDSLGARLLDSALEKRSGALKNPISADDRAALAAGQKIYGDNCAGCHGDAKAPSNWGSHNFYPRVPQFYQQGGDVSPEEAFAAIHDGIRYTGMAGWHDQLGDKQIWQVANFVSHIKHPARAPDRD
jgi:mono/diheme cytochrome c family protein